MNLTNPFSFKNLIWLSTQNVLILIVLSFVDGAYNDKIDNTLQTKASIKCDCTLNTPNVRLSKPVHLCNFGLETNICTSDTTNHKYLTVIKSCKCEDLKFVFLVSYKNVPILATYGSSLSTNLINRIGKENTAEINKLTSVIKCDGFTFALVGLFSYTDTKGVTKQRKDIDILYHKLDLCMKQEQFTPPKSNLISKVTLFVLSSIGNVAKGTPIEMATKVLSKVVEYGPMILDMLDVSRDARIADRVTFLNMYNTITTMERKCDSKFGELKMVQCLTQMTETKPVKEGKYNLILNSCSKTMSENIEIEAFDGKSSLFKINSKQIKSICENGVSKSIEVNIPKLEKITYKFYKTTPRHLIHQHTCPSSNICHGLMDKYNKIGIYDKRKAKPTFVYLIFSMEAFTK